MQKIKRALLSVSDKSHIIELAQALTALNIEVVSTGGTAQVLLAAGIPVTPVTEVTNFPEIMNGRVKTLHPAIFAGLLYRGAADHEVLTTHNIQPFELVVINLYPFLSTISQANCDLATAIENIDIGGPAMIRAAAKNYQHIAVLTNPDEYTAFIKQVNEQQGMTNEPQRLALAQKAFNHTAYYDSIINQYLSQQLQTPTTYPEQLVLPFTKLNDLRYGENPHQTAACYQPTGSTDLGIAQSQLLQGKPLSYNNLNDGNCALECIKTLKQPACVIVKHANPCGVAYGHSLLDAYQKAFATDSTSAFGGIIAFNTTVDKNCAEKILQNQFAELIIAPQFATDALALFSTKPNLRCLQYQLHGHTAAAFDIKSLHGSVLLQSPDHNVLTFNDCKLVTKRPIPAERIDDLMLAWHIVRFVKSNAVIFVNHGQTVAIGAGQMSRVFSVQIAKLKADQAHLSLKGSVCASDAFFPFADNITEMQNLGIDAIIQPGGSVRDSEVIQAADQANIAMVFTGIRHFNH